MTDKYMHEAVIAVLRARGWPEPWRNMIGRTPLKSSSWSGTYSAGEVWLDDGLCRIDYAVGIEEGRINLLPQATAMEIAETIDRLRWVIGL
jgi:hypothetical protein